MLKDLIRNVKNMCEQVENFIREVQTIKKEMLEMNNSIRNDKLLWWDYQHTVHIRRKN